MDTFSQDDIQEPTPCCITAQELIVTLCNAPLVYPYMSLYSCTFSENHLPTTTLHHHLTLSPNILYFFHTLSHPFCPTTPLHSTCLHLSEILSFCHHMTIIVGSMTEYPNQSVNQSVSKSILSPLSFPHCQSQPLTWGCHTMPSGPPMVKSDHQMACIGRARAVVARANTMDCVAAITFPSSPRNMTCSAAMDHPYRAVGPHSPPQWK